MGLKYLKYWCLIAGLNTSINQYLHLFEYKRRNYENTSDLGIGVCCVGVMWW